MEEVKRFISRDCFGQLIVVSRKMLFPPIKDD